MSRVLTSILITIAFAVCLWACAHQAGKRLNTPPKTAPDLVAKIPENLDAAFLKTPAGADIHWAPENLPIMLSMTESAKAWAPSMKLAAKTWNDLLGFNAFIFVEGPLENPEKYMMTPGVIPVFQVLGLVNRAETGFDADLLTGEMRGCSIFMPTGRYPASVAFLMAMHELGHSLGLAHDEKILGSLMYPKLGPVDFDAIDVTEGDILRLQRTYGLN